MVRMMRRITVEWDLNEVVDTLIDKVKTKDPDFHNSTYAGKEQYSEKACEIVGKGDYNYVVEVSVKKSSCKKPTYKLVND